MYAGSDQKWQSVPILLLLIDPAATHLCVFVCVLVFEYPSTQSTNKVRTVLQRGAILSVHNNSKGLFEGRGGCQA